MLSINHACDRALTRLCLLVGAVWDLCRGMGAIFDKSVLGAWLGWDYHPKWYPALALRVPARLRFLR